ncbi:MAG TPA: ureidoglycolate lyase [Leptolyngbyaceae cyanobacterium]
MSQSVVLQSLSAQTLTAEGFAPFGQVIWPDLDGASFGPRDAQLQLQNGIPRFYIMQLENRGLRFHRITRHQQCTQCLGALEGKEWVIAVAPPGASNSPDPSGIQAFRIPGNCFIKLEVGTWHAGPYFEADKVNFYNLELSDTNLTDHETCDLAQAFGLEFEIRVS